MTVIHSIDSTTWDACHQIRRTSVTPLSPQISLSSFQAASVCEALPKWRGAFNSHRLSVFDNKDSTSSRLNPKPLATLACGAVGLTLVGSWGIALADTLIKKAFFSRLGLTSLTLGLLSAGLSLAVSGCRTDQPPFLPKCKKEGAESKLSGTYQTKGGLFLPKGSIVKCGADGSHLIKSPQNVHTYINEKWGSFVIAKNTFFTTDSNGIANSFTTAQEQKVGKIKIPSGSSVVLPQDLSNKGLSITISSAIDIAVGKVKLKAPKGSILHFDKDCHLVKITFYTPTLVNVGAIKIPFPGSGSYILISHQNKGSVSSAKLGEAITIQKIPCGIGQCRFDKNGKLVKFILGKKFTIGDHTFPARTEVTLTASLADKGKPYEVTLGGPFTTSVGSQKITFGKADSIRWDNEKFKVAWVKNPTTFTADGFPVTVASGSSFHASGKGQLQDIGAATATKMKVGKKQDAVTVAKEKYIRLHPGTTKVKEITLGADATIQGKALKKGSIVTFDKNGCLDWVTLAGPLTVKVGDQTITFPAKTFVAFYLPSGKVWKATVNGKNPLKIKVDRTTLSLGQNSQVKFDKNGRLERIDYKGEKTKIGNQVINKSATLFFKNGKLNRVANW